MRHSELPDVKKYFAWIPHRVSSGKLVWFNSYYIEQRYSISADPRHRHLIETHYTEWEYFLKKLTQN